MISLNIMSPRGAVATGTLFWAGYYFLKKKSLQCGFISSVLKQLHHLIGEAVGHGLENNIFRGDPLRVLKLRFIHTDGGITVHVAVEACQDVDGDAPGLGLLVADVLNFKAVLLHDLP